MKRETCTSKVLFLVARSVAWKSIFKDTSLLSFIPNVVISRYATKIFDEPVNQLQLDCTSDVRNGVARIILI